MYLSLRHETKLIRYGGLIQALTTLFTFAGFQQLMTGVTFLTFVATGGELTLQRVFTTISLLILLKRNAGTFLIRGFFLLYEVSVALKRIQV